MTPPAAAPSRTEYLSDPLKRQVAQRLIRARHSFIFLDYDGTLTPIMPKPSMARFRESTRQILAKLAAHVDFTVGIITGRRLDEIKELVRLDTVLYAGNHGLEMEGPGYRLTHQGTRQFQRIRPAIIAALEPLADEYAGAFIEDKQIGVAFHFRMVDPERVPELETRFAREIEPWTSARQVSVLEVKKALEIRPHVQWNKGSAVLWTMLREDPDAACIYIGDDRTDEHAFKALGERAVTVRVGFHRETHARYFVNDVFEVERLLAFLGLLKET